MAYTILTQSLTELYDWRRVVVTSKHQFTGTGDVSQIVNTMSYTIGHVNI